MGLPVTGERDDLVGETGAEHEGLQLQRAVQQPQQAQRDLQVAAGDAHAMRKRNCADVDLAFRTQRSRTHSGLSSRAPPKCDPG